MNKVNSEIENKTAVNTQSSTRKHRNLKIRSIPKQKTFTKEESSSSENSLGRVVQSNEEFL